MTMVELIMSLCRIIFYDMDSKFDTMKTHLSLREGVSVTTPT